MTKSLCLSTLTQRGGAINLQRTWRDITQLKQDKAPLPLPLPLTQPLLLILSLLSAAVTCPIMRHVCLAMPKFRNLFINFSRIFDSNISRDR